MYKKNNNEREGKRNRVGRAEKPNFEKGSFRGKPKPRTWGEDSTKPARKFSGNRDRNDENPESQGNSGERKPFRGKSFDKPYSRPFDRPSRDRKDNNAGGESKPFRTSRPQRSFDKPYRKEDRERPHKRFDSNEGFERTEEKQNYGDKPFNAPYKRNENNLKFKERKPFYEKEGEDNRTQRPRVRINKESKPKDDGRVRLNKIIAASGICSRREADDMISAGLISVNGSIISELGSKVFPTDDIRYNGERLRQERLVYIVMNKPKDFVTTTKDPFAKKTVMELLAGSCKERVFPVGRLDRNTTGVLLITNDGDLAKKLTHPSHNKKKIYHVHLDKGLKHTDLEAIVKGIELEDGFVKADEISFIDPEDKKQIGVEIHSGQNRVVRRIFEQLGYKVSKLDRVYFAGLTKKGLQRGQWRFLTNQEVGILKMGSYQ